MTVLDRNLTDRSTEAELEVPPVSATAAASSTGVLRPAWCLLAALLTGAGAIHLAMVPSHAQEWTAEGVAFALAAWLQIGLAVALIATASLRAVRWAVAVNLVFIAVWAVSRTSGLPVGPEAWERHPVSAIDVTCVVFEAMMVLLGMAVLLRPGLGSRLRSGARAVAAIVPALVVLGVTTAAVASPSAADHAHGGEAGHDHGATAAAGHDHDMAGMSDEEMAAHEAHSAAELAFLFPDGDDKGWSELSNGDQHGVHPPDVPFATLDAATRQTLEHQLALTVQAAQEYPTVAAAEAAGYRRQGPLSPGLGAHYTGGAIDYDGSLTDDELLHPSTIVFDGTDPDSVIAGFMFISIASPEALADSGFAGPNDHWHTHAGVCLKSAGNGANDALGADGDITQAQCEAEGGSFMDVTPSLLHVWTSPQYTSPLGVFSHLNPAVTCPDGTYTKRCGAS